MSFFESDYAPTDTDLLDWINVLKLNEAEDFGDDTVTDAEQEYRDSQGDLGDSGNDDMDGDATSALESVFGPEDYYPEYDYDEGWCDFEDNEGFAC